MTKRYEVVTKGGVMVTPAVDGSDGLRQFATGRCDLVTTEGYSDKIQRLPVIRRPSYATGLSVAGRLGVFEYALQHEEYGLREYSSIVAGQFTLRF